MAITTGAAFAATLDRIDATPADRPVTEATYASLMAYVDGGPVLLARFVHTVRKRGTADEKDGAKSITRIARDLLGKDATAKDVESKRVRLSTMASQYDWLVMAKVPATADTFRDAGRAWAAPKAAKEENARALSAIADAPEAERVGMLHTLAEKGADAKARAAKAREAEAAAKKAKEEAAKVAKAKEEAEAAKRKARPNDGTTVAERTTAWIDTLAILVSMAEAGRIALTGRQAEKAADLLASLQEYSAAENIVPVV